jgi:cell division septal protein FtsQ
MVKPASRRPRNRRVKQGRKSTAALNLGALWQFTKTAVVWTGSLALVCGLTFAGYSGWQHFQQSDSLLVKSIEVAGIQRVAENEVLAYADLKLGIPVFDINLADSAESVRQHPWIDEATVRRRLPDGIFVDVKEFTTGILVSMGNLYLANPQGRIFKRLSRTDSVDLPIVTGLSPAKNTEEQLHNQEILTQAMALAASIAEHEPVMGRLEEVHYDSHLHWSIVTSHSHEGDGVLTMHLGEHPGRRLSVARQVLGQLRQRTRVPRVIWLDGETHPERVHIRFADSGQLADSTTFTATLR